MDRLISEAKSVKNANGQTNSKLRSTKKYFRLESLKYFLPFWFWFNDNLSDSDTFNFSGSWRLRVEKVAGWKQFSSEKLINIEMGYLWSQFLLHKLFNLNAEGRFIDDFRFIGFLFQYI